MLKDVILHPPGKIGESASAGKSYSVMKKMNSSKPVPMRKTIVANQRTYLAPFDEPVSAIAQQAAPTPKTA